MRTGGEQFFSIVGRDYHAEKYEALVYDVAYFWRVSPAFVLGLPLTVFGDYVKHANRINEIRSK